MTMPSALKAVVAIFGALTLLGFLDRYSSYFELATFFRLQYVVLLGAAALAALLLRLFPIALAALLFFAVNLLVIAPGGVARETTETDSARLRLLVVNVQQGNGEYQRLARLITETDPDVVGLIELTPAWATGLQTALGRFPNRRLEAQRGAYGIGLYSKLPFAAASVERLPPDGPPSVLATITLDGEDVGFVLTHVHTPLAGGIHQRQLEALGKARGRLEDRLAICGDFNAVPWSQPVRRLASATSLRAVHRGYGLGGTWPAAFSALRVPIDNCLVSEGLALLDWRVGPDVGSDHLPIIVDLALTGDQ